MEDKRVEDAAEQWHDTHDALDHDFVRKPAEAIEAMLMLANKCTCYPLLIAAELITRMAKLEGKDPQVLAMTALAMHKQMLANEHTGTVN